MSPCTTVLAVRPATTPSRHAARRLAPVAAASLLCLLLAGGARAEAAGDEAAPSLLAIAATPSVAPSSRLLDEHYAAALHDRVAAAARYPTSREARQLQPQGAVALWVDIDRSGRVLDAKISEGSGQALLDAQALRDVRNARYPAFPAAAFAGESSHRFAMTLNYAVAEH